MDTWASTPVLTCRSCGTELPSDAKFCWHCGTRSAGPESSGTELDEVTALEKLHSLIRFGWIGDEAPAIVPGLIFEEPIAAIKRILARFPHLANEPVGKERWTALHRVAYGVPDKDIDEKQYKDTWRRKDALNALLALPEIDVDARDWEGNTPLHIALRCCPQLPYGNEDSSADIHDPFMIRIQMEVISSLLNLGADPNAVNQDNGQTPVHLAAMRGRNHVLYYLMCLHGGDPLLLDKRRWSAVHYATQYGYTHVLNLINEELEDRAKADQPAPLPEPLTPPDPH